MTVAVAVDVPRSPSDLIEGVTHERILRDTREDACKMKYKGNAVRDTPSPRSLAFRKMKVYVAPVERGDDDDRQNEREAHARPVVL
jgi:hypothetical protein